MDVAPLPPISAEAITVEQFSFPPRVSREILRARLETAGRRDRPRLLVDAGAFARLRARVAEEPAVGAVAAAVLREAQALLAVPPVERVVQGRRLLGVSCRVVKRTILLGMAYRLTGERAFAARCERELTAAAAFTDWNPSHFLDTGELALALAIGYDWLHDELDPAVRVAVRTALVRHALQLPEQDPSMWWVRAENNWGQVCHGGLTAAALALWEDEPDLAVSTLDRMLCGVVSAMGVYAPRGAYPEGPSYWSYGTTYNVLLVAVLESVLGTDFGLSAAPGFEATGGYLDIVTGPSGRTFNYSDGGEGREPECARLWFAARYERPDWAVREHALFARWAAQADGSRVAGAGGRFHPLALLWMASPHAAGESRLPLHWQGEGPVPIAVHRSSWDDRTAVFVGVKAGPANANHGHMDAGSFVLDADGVRWALDLGAEPYDGIEARGMKLWDMEQDADRWKVFRISSLSHNTLTIDGHPHLAAGHARIEAFSDAPDGPHTVVDLTPALAGQTARAVRGVALLPSGEVWVRDRLTGLRPGAKVRWGMVTQATPEGEGERVVLRQEGAALVLHAVLAAGASWQTVDTATPPNEWDSPNPGTRMLALVATADDSGVVDFGVLATPGSCQRSAIGSLDLASPEVWAR